MNVLEKTAVRSVVHRTRGSTHGPITRLMSPADLGEDLKPFVFLDYFDDQGRTFPNFVLHPHSGIATLTYIVEGKVTYEDTGGATGVLGSGGVEWMRAGKGIWHGGGGANAARTRGFQLWIALPPELELGATESVYQSASDIPHVGPARVLLGAYQGIGNAIVAPSPITYLAVSLGAGERWRYVPDADHETLWVAVSDGALGGASPVDRGELAMFEPGSGPVDFVAETPTQFVLGSAARHRHDLILGYYSVHTSAAALQAGEAHIREIDQELRQTGRR